VNATETNSKGEYLTEQAARQAFEGFVECAKRAGVSSSFHLYQHPRSKGFGLWPAHGRMPKSYRLIETLHEVAS
jgi:hypothetical protein